MRPATTKLATVLTQSTSASTLAISIPEKLIPVFTGSADYRAAYGGRGSGKTKAFAKMAAVFGMRYAAAGITGKIVVVRQFKNSVDESSFAEIKWAINDEPLLAAYYDVGERYIRTKCGRVKFIVIGSERNMESIKGIAPILIFWIDEAEELAEKAWDIILPTVRGPYAETWATWNPRSETSATHQMFRVNPPPNLKIAELNYLDNPTFPENLERLRQHMEATNQAKHDHVWLGKFRSGHDSIFKLDIIERFETPPGFDYSLVICDTAASTEDDAAFTVFSLWGVNTSGYYLLNIVRERYDADDLLSAAIGFWNKASERSVILPPPDDMKIENKSSGIGLIQQLNNRGIPATKIERGRDSGGKDDRAINAVMKLRELNMKLYIPLGATWFSDGGWIADYLKEIKDATYNWTDIGYWDQVDVTSDAINIDNDESTDWLVELS